ncbi:hypothetical protein PRIPAC_78731 [Pristionchus pacificus]|uniref:Uncharacterized protein n=1 Tax=Pristionchus pacificus TaxID=54126 RepID=A0A2A6BWB5_PRIPA|nr:hypothetical protein PRIPAC_78731 [Pristionchus pacificus]|eukprot:PDM70292.1 hypothetical protein PRIPAC_46538 [Pristionchus pacificus]
MDGAAVLLPLITMLPILVLCKQAGKPKDGSGSDVSGLSTMSTLSGTSRASTTSNANVDSGTTSGTSFRAPGKSEKERPKVEIKEDAKISPLKSPLAFNKEIVVPIGKASVETPMKSNMSKRENRKKDSSRSSKRVVRFK